MEATGGFSSIPEDQERASEDFINPESHQGMYNYNPGKPVSSSSSCESISDSSSASDSCSEMMMEIGNGEQEVILVTKNKVGQKATALIISYDTYKVTW